MSRKRRPLISLLRRIYGEDQALAGALQDHVRVRARLHADGPEYTPADAEANAKGCYDLAISTMRAKLESFHRVDIGPHRCYLGNCEALLPLLGSVDAVVTDPPYGIGADELAQATARNRIKAAGKSKAGRGWKLYEGKAWDRDRPDQKILQMIMGMSKHQIIWGGNYFTDMLPPTMQWLIWDKGQRDFSLADFEVAWSSQEAASRIIDFSRAKALLDGKEHPTQKPIEVMKWCLERLPPKTNVILDPFMGSGTTGVACQKLGRRFIGIELDPGYFEIACRRITEAMNQPDMFVQPPAPEAEQLALPEGL